MYMLTQADCLDFLKTINDSSIDLIATDPPYFRVKTAFWDRQWKTKADFFEWLNKVVKEYARVLKPTGSLYLFCGPYLSSETENLINQHLNVLNHIVWRKPTGRHLGTCVPSQRKYFPQTERIIFAESGKKQPFQYESIRRYLSESVKKAGLSRKDTETLTSTQMSAHWFGKSQFSIPSENHYKKLQNAVPQLNKSFKELRNWYLDIRDGEKKGRRTFKAKKGGNTDVWDFPVVQPYVGKHPCEKPLDLMRHIIKTSTNRGDIVLDTFIGSGSTAIAALELERKFLGCEMGYAEFQQAKERLSGYV